MAKSERTAFLIVTALLVTLMFVILWRTSSSKDSARVYRISVITDDVQGDYSQNIRKGLDRAARDYNVDLQIIALHGGMNIEQQKSFLLREMESGANAVIINLQQYPDLLEQTNLSGTTVPIVLLGSAWNGPATTRSVSSDDVMMGRMLATEMLRDGVTDCFVRATSDNARIRLREQGLMDVLDAAGVHNSLERDASSAIWVNIPAGAAVAALDEQSMERLAVSSLSGRVKVFGIGCTNELLYYMEAGVIDRLIVEDGYAMGYLSVRSAVESVEGKSILHERIISSYVADAQHLYEEPLQHVLFPIS